VNTLAVQREIESMARSRHSDVSQALGFAERLEFRERPNGGIRGLNVGVALALPMVDPEVFVRLGKAPHQEDDRGL
jgi:hypothetical protein